MIYIVIARGCNVNFNMDFRPYRPSLPMKEISNIWFVFLLNIYVLDPINRTVPHWGSDTGVSDTAPAVLLFVVRLAL